MSAILLKGKTAELFQKLQIQVKARFRRDVRYLNSPEFCMICFGKPEVVKDVDSTMITSLIRHHISYFPEVIAYVHYDCHRRIHDTPLDAFIQYADGDSRKFYDMKRERAKNET